MLVASGLIVQMVFWMRKHGRTFKKDLEADMARNARAGELVGPARRRRARRRVAKRPKPSCSCTDSAPRRAASANLPIVLVLGVGAAFATFWLLQQGSRILSWRVFFRVSEILLLLLAGALLVSGVEKLIALDVLPQLVDPVWDTSRLLDDSGRVGGLIASFTGYRARPALLPLLALALYWVARVDASCKRSELGSAAPAPRLHRVDTMPRAERN